jgi:hypothetical protein
MIQTQKEKQTMATDFGYYPRTGWKGLQRKERSIWQIFIEEGTRALRKLMM